MARGQGSSNEPIGPRGLWAKLAETLEDPWDWAAATAGGAAGCVGTIILHGTDLGSSTAGGALAAVSASKAFRAGVAGRALRRRANAFLENIQNDTIARQDNTIQIITKLEYYIKLHRDGGITNNDFENTLRSIQNEYYAIRFPSSGQPTRRSRRRAAPGEPAASRG
jgi:hypothetical protein